MDAISEEVSKALTDHVQSRQANTQRIRHVSLWSLQVVARTILSGLKHYTYDPLAAHM